MLMSLVINAKSVTICVDVYWLTVQDLLLYVDVHLLSVKTSNYILRSIIYQCNYGLLYVQL